MKNRSVAIVGSKSLLGQDVKQIFSEQAPDVTVRSLDDAEFSILTEQGGEPVLVGAIDESSLTSAPVLILAGSAEGARRARGLAADIAARPAIIDLTQPPDEDVEAMVRAPLVEPPDLGVADAGMYRIAHSTAIALAQFFGRLHAKAKVAHSVVNAFEPASLQGREGIEELQHQTMKLLSFTPLPQGLFDAQLSFNMLPAYGEESRLSITAIERQVASDLETLLPGVPMPSLRLMQAPVFHGLTLSIWVELARKTSQANLIKALAGDRVEIRGAGEPPPNNVGIAGQSGISIGRIEPDPRNPRAFWIWVVADNHRVVAENAVCLARLLIPVEGRA